MTDQQRKALIEALGMYMSHLSEEVYMASWHIDFSDDDLPRLLRDIVDGKIQYGEFDEYKKDSGLDYEDAFICCAIADVLGHWVTPTDKEEREGDRYMAYTPKWMRVKND